MRDGRVFVPRAQVSDRSLVSAFGELGGDLSFPFSLDVSRASVSMSVISGSWEYEKGSGVCSAGTVNLDSSVRGSCVLTFSQTTVWISGISPS